MRGDVAVLPRQGKAVAVAVAFTIDRHDFQRLHDLVKTGKAIPVARLADQQHLRPVHDSRRFEMRKRAVVAIKRYGTQGQVNADARSCLLHIAQVHSFQHGIVLAEKFRALQGRQNACRLIAIGALPFGHRPACAAPERPIDGGAIITRPLQGDLQLFLFVPGQQRL